MGEVAGFSHISFDKNEMVHTRTLSVNQKFSMAKFIGILLILGSMLIHISLLKEKFMFHACFGMTILVIVLYR